MSSAKFKISQTPLFARTVKKFKKQEKSALDSVVKMLLENPEMGEEKKGDLLGIRVHKYKFNKQLMLLSYSVSKKEVILITVGAHENYYRDLKNYLG